MEKQITDDLDALLDALPPHLSEPIRGMSDRSELLEVVIDLGRAPEARFPAREAILSEREVRAEDIDYVVAHIGAFGDDNRAGIERTLHRISALRNRKGSIVGLTCRVGRAVFGTIRVIEDIVQSGRSLLLLGRPGVGKTTMLREVARVLADDMGKRVVIVDTSNEIAGDGDIPHPAIGRARRMQVRTPALQHAVMIEAVENHMPEVIVIDEIGTELEAAASRTIAERGVQLVATAHGNTLENLMLNPTLSDLVGGIQSVTLGDEEARRRGTQKSVLERKAPPSFDAVVEIQTWDRVAIHHDVAETVDGLLRGSPVSPEIRYVSEGGQIVREGRPPLHEVRHDSSRPSRRIDGATMNAPPARLTVFPFGISRVRLEQAIREAGFPVLVATDLGEADALLTLRTYYRRRPETLREAETRGIPIYVLKNSSTPQIQQSLAGLCEAAGAPDPVTAALQETEQAIEQVIERERPVELGPQNAYLRRLQHQLIERSNLSSRSTGREPYRRVTIFPG